MILLLSKTVLQINIGRGWLERYFAGIQIVRLDQQPQWPPQSWFYAFYFLVFMLFGYVVIRRLFVGVVLQTFMTVSGIKLLTVGELRN
jgi:hypothetical protein